MSVHPVDGPRSVGLRPTMWSILNEASWAACDKGPDSPDRTCSCQMTAQRLSAVRQTKDRDPFVSIGCAPQRPVSVATSRDASTHLSQSGKSAPRACPLFPYLSGNTPG